MERGKEGKGRKESGGILLGGMGGWGLWSDRVGVVEAGENEGGGVPWRMWVDFASGVLGRRHDGRLVVLSLVAHAQDMAGSGRGKECGVARRLEIASCTPDS